MPDWEIIEIMNGMRFEIIVSSQMSNYTCCVFTQLTPPGGGPPPHKHLREEEIFTPIEGRYEFFREGVWSPMEIGVPVFSPRNEVHAFRNVGDTPAKMMFVTNNGGIDDYFRAISTLKMPEELAKLDEITEHYGQVFVPPAATRLIPEPE